MPSWRRILTRGVGLRESPTVLFRKAIATAVTIVVLVLSAGSARAQICGDADGSKGITVTDGIMLLRDAAGLSGPCTSNGDPCDVDGDGSVTISDGIQALRVAAGLLPASDLTCGAEITRFIKKIGQTRGVDGSPFLDISKAPVANSPALKIASAEGLSTLGNINVTGTYSVRYDLSKAAEGRAELILAARSAEGTLANGFFALPLSASSGTVEFLIDFAANPVIGKKFTVEILGRSGDAVSPGESLGITLMVTTIFGGVCKPCGPRAGCQGGSRNGACCVFNSDCDGAMCALQGRLSCLQ